MRNRTKYFGISRVQKKILAHFRMVAKLDSGHRASTVEAAPAEYGLGSTMKGIPTERWSPSRATPKTQKQLGKRKAEERSGLTTNNIVLESIREWFMPPHTPPQEIQGPPN